MWKGVLQDEFVPTFRANFRSTNYVRAYFTSDKGLSLLDGWLGRRGLYSDETTAPVHSDYKAKEALGWKRANRAMNTWYEYP
jgi:hypothetical protein